MATPFGRTTPRVWVQSLFERLDAPLLFAMVLLAGAGLLAMYSSGYDDGARFIDHTRNACIAFAIVAMPLGITAQRKETSVGFAISLALAFGYFFFVVLAEMLRDDVALHPYLLLWVPNVLFIGIGAWLLLRLDHR